MRDVYARGYVFVYSMVHIIMGIMNIYPVVFPVGWGFFERTLLVIVGVIGIWCAKSVHETCALTLVMSVLFSYAFVAEWFALYPWSIPFTHLQYVAAALLNLVYAVCFYRIGR